jgi:hypothetical protein
MSRRVPFSFFRGNVIGEGDHDCDQRQHPSADRRHWGARSAERAGIIPPRNRSRQPGHSKTASRMILGHETSGSIFSPPGGL